MSHQGNHSHGGMKMNVSSPALHTTEGIHHGHKTDRGHGGDLHAEHGETAMHAMNFHLNADLNLWFEQWEISSTKVLIAACIALLVLSALYEGLKIFRVRLMSQTSRTQRRGESSNTLNITGPRLNSRTKMFSLAHLSQTILHVVQLLLGYLLMLVVMTYQVYIGLAVIIGAGLGYFLFASFVGGKCQSLEDVHKNPSPESPVIVLKAANLNEKTTEQEMNNLSFPEKDNGFENQSFEN